MMLKINLFLNNVDVCICNADRCCLFCSRLVLGAFTIEIVDEVVLTN